MIKDEKLNALLDKEVKRQQESIDLIASENLVSSNVSKFQGSVLTNKYAEGYSSKRYYEGCDIIDQVENLAQQRLCELFGAKYANVQPHSGSQANQAVLLALLKPGDTILGMSLDCGGHLTHGFKVTMSGKWFNAVSYGVNEISYLIDYEQVHKLAIQYKPKLIICGCSAYSRVIDFSKFAHIAQLVGAYLLADVAHIAGLIASGLHPNPLGYADVVTSTTHKTLRGPRGGIIMTNHADIAKKVNSAVFPGIQGGPFMHTIGAKAAAFFEALQPAFKEYSKQVITNAKTLARVLQERGYSVLTGGTDNHVIILKLDMLSGKEAAFRLASIGIVCNKNSVPFDVRPPAISSGIRLGSPACTTRGMSETEFEIIGNCIADVLDVKNWENVEDIIDKKKAIVKSLCDKFPINC
ncbi:serine hydroxymethyltransferase [Candidatus Sneabacter namystus]|uniref:Serine hydroxymethyltransferase n=1 Tax=Candidatus Sneabacter namystus TaxID=2601646 RepID=A0A5C0UIH9_9RICK|nr:serine hydroxymethyltransferase [Candidatus Sneabacter namystus]QEK39876.1 serine hydroxymethyltransferase [Candidatus Sneabacter namystus]